MDRTIECPLNAQRRASDDVMGSDQVTIVMSLNYVPKRLLKLTLVGDS